MLDKQYKPVWIIVLMVSLLALGACSDPADGLTAGPAVQAETAAATLTAAVTVTTQPSPTRTATAQGLSPA